LLTLFLVGVPLRGAQLVCRNEAQSYLNKEFSSDLLLAIRYLINGFFQAEGSWSGQFQSSSSHRFGPKFSIGQNVSDESLHLFSIMWAILGCKLVWDISKTKLETIIFN
jgi:hypothetical protein